MKKGEQMSKESKLKMSLAKIGKSPWNKGKSGYKNAPCSKERKEKISKSRKGIVFSKEHIENLRNAHLGQKAWNKGTVGVLKHSEETRLKMSDSKKGAGSYQYKTDRSLLKKSEKKHLDSRYKEWMLSVKERDNWICQMKSDDCQGRLESYHIKNWQDNPHQRYDIDNGITLCSKHHPIGRLKEKETEMLFSQMIQKTVPQTVV